MEQRVKEGLRNIIQISERRYELLKSAAMAAHIADDIHQAEELDRLGIEEYCRLCELRSKLRSSRFS